MFKFNEEEYSKVINTYEEGTLSIKKIASATKLDVEVVRAYLLRARKEGRIESVYKKLVKLYNSGVTNYLEIQKQTGASLSTISTYLVRASEVGDINKARRVKKVKVDTPKPVSTAQRNYDDTVELYNSGLRDYSEIASIMGVTEKTIKNRIKKGAKSGDIHFNSEDYSMVEKLYKQGDGPLEIARTLKLNMSTTRKMLMDLYEKGRIEMRNTPKRKKNIEISKDEER